MSDKFDVAPVTSESAVLGWRIDIGAYRVVSAIDAQHIPLFITILYRNDGFKKLNDDTGQLGTYRKDWPDQIDDHHIVAYVRELLQRRREERGDIYGV